MTKSTVLVTLVWKLSSNQKISGFDKSKSNKTYKNYSVLMKLVYETFFDLFITKFYYRKIIKFNYDNYLKINFLNLNFIKSINE